jgi:predicted ATPase
MSVTRNAAAAVRFDARAPGYSHQRDGAAVSGSTFEQKYASVDEVARTVLRRLAIFSSEFTLQAASAVVACSEIRSVEVAAALATLHQGVLIEGRGEGASARYRLTRQTRAFALLQLASNSEIDVLSRNHAEYLQHLFEYAEVELDRGVASQWLANYGRLIDDVRAALDWAFSPSGDAAIGVGLTVAAIPLWVLCSRPDELCSRIERALNSEAAPTHSAREMTLRIAARLAGMSGLEK